MPSPEPVGLREARFFWRLHLALPLGYRSDVHEDTHRKVSVGYWLRSFAVDWIPAGGVLLVPGQGFPSTFWVSFFHAGNIGVAFTPRVGRYIRSE